jgi:hypothetical protein
MLVSGAASKTLYVHISKKSLAIYKSVFDEKAMHNGFTGPELNVLFS